MPIFKLKKKKIICINFSILYNFKSTVKCKTKGKNNMKNSFGNIASIMTL